MVNFLDITINLNTSKYYSYRKPNVETVYSHETSNHLPTVIRNLVSIVSK